MYNHDQRRVELIEQVKLVLSNAGVPSAAYAKTLAGVIGVAIAQAYRKLNGASTFTLPQIEAFERAYGVEIWHVAANASEAKSKAARIWSDAVFTIDGHSLDCRIVVGASRKTRGHQFAAFLSRGIWYVCLPEEYAGTGPLFDVEAMHMVTILQCIE